VIKAEEEDDQGKWRDFEEEKREEIR